MFEILNLKYGVICAIVVLCTVTTFQHFLLTPQRLEDNALMFPSVKRKLQTPKEKPRDAQERGAFDVEERVEDLLLREGDNLESWLVGVGAQLENLLLFIWSLYLLSVFLYTRYSTAMYIVQGGPGSWRGGAGWRRSAPGG